MTITIKNRISPFAAIVFACMFLGFGTGVSKTTIRFATLAPANSPWMKVMQELNIELGEKTDGEVSFKFYPNMSMGNESDVIRKMRMGQINAAGFTGFGLGMVASEIRIFELPFLFESTTELNYVMDKAVEDMRKKLLDRGYVLLGWADVGWVYFFSVGKEISEPKDFKDLKPWMWQGDPLAESFYHELGKSPVSLPITDVNLSLQTGLIDAVYCSPIAALALQWFTQLNYVSTIPFTYAIGAVLVDVKTFNKLSQPHQDILLELSTKHLRNLQLQTRIDGDESFQQLLKEGIVPVSSTKLQWDLFKSVGEEVQVNLSDYLYPKATLDSIKTYIHQFRIESQTDTDAE